MYDHFDHINDILKLEKKYVGEVMISSSDDWHMPKRIWPQIYLHNQLTYQIISKSNNAPYIYWRKRSLF